MVGNELGIRKLEAEKGRQIEKLNTGLVRGKGRREVPLKGEVPI